MHAYIKWGYLIINDYEFNPRKEQIILADDISKNAAIQFEEKYPDLFSVLFIKNESNPELLKLKIPFSLYLGTNSRSDQEMILRSFFDNNGSEQYKSEKYKPLYLSRDSYDMEVYKLFCQIIKNVNDYEEIDFGVLELGFDDSRGFVASDGEEEWEADVKIFYDGGHWTK